MGILFFGKFRTGSILNPSLGGIRERKTSEMTLRNLSCRVFLIFMIPSYCKLVSFFSKS